MELLWDLIITIAVALLTSVVTSYVVTIKIVKKQNTSRGMTFIGNQATGNSGGGFVVEDNRKQ